MSSIKPELRVGLVIFVLALSPLPIGAQVFLSMNDSLNIHVVQPSASFGTGITVFDINNDGWDDFVIPRNSGSTIAYINTGSGFNPQLLFTNSLEIKAVLFGDYDRDGDADAFCTYRYSNPRLYRNDGAFPLVNVTASSGLDNLTTGIVYGSTWGDYNGDGWLDLYFAVYNGEARFLMKNNGNGTFTNMAEYAGLLNEFSFPFQPVLFDVDKDGDQDLDVIVDYAPPDELHLNDGNGFFSDVANDAGYSVAIYSMSNSWADYDQDGDFDKYVGELPSVGNHLFENDGELHFTDVAVEKGLALYQFTWGALWVDINNDTWEDLYIANANFDAVDFDRVFINHAGEFSEEIEFAGPSLSIKAHSIAKGDFNNDGYYDLVVSSMSPGPEVQIYYNLGGAHNSFKLDLSGVQSNSDGYGTRIEYWAGENHVTRLALSGQNYLSQDSQHLILSLGEAAYADSLTIYWPSGQIDSYGRVPADVRLSAIEGQPSTLHLTPSGPVCIGDSAHVWCEINTALVWNNHIEATELWPDAPGSFSAWYIDESGSIWYTDTVQISFISPIEPILNLTNPTCPLSTDGMIELMNEESFLATIWNEELTTPDVTQLGEGAMHGQFMDFQGCIYDTLVYIIPPDSLILMSYSIAASCYSATDGSIVLDSIFGGTPPYTFQLEGSTQSASEGPVYFNELAEGQFELVVTDSFNCLNFYTIEVTQPDSLFGTLSIFEEGLWCSANGGIEPYTYSWSTGSSTPYSGVLYDGVHTIQVTDSFGCSWEHTTITSHIRGEYAPFKDCIQIENSEIQWVCPFLWDKLEVYDLKGRLVSADIASTRIKLSCGIYFVRAIDRNGNFYRSPIYIP